MFEAHPFLTLLGCLAILTVFAAQTDLDEAWYGILFAIIVIVWAAWAVKIPDTPEEIAEKELKIAKAKEKETPRELNKIDGCTVYVFERQGREHFFTRCESTTSTETNWTEGCGKGCSRDVKDTIVTPNAKVEK